MGDIPVPRSYQQILGDQIDAFLSKQGISNLRVGSPILSMLEAAAQSDFRSSQDIFTLLNSIALSKATGLALERIGNDENVPKLQQSAASGVVTISDSSFTKKSTKLFQGSPAPIVGSSSLDVVDASTWPATGSVYVGRGTPNYEGALAYVSKTNNGTHWTLALSGSTVKFHNTLETVILAQGGNRVIGPGVVVRTPQGNVSNAIEFKVLYSATIPDGETSITGVQVQALLPGIIGNVPANAVNQFSTAPFTGATVVNPAPFSNGLATENDDSYRERIKLARRTRARGTSLAITTAVTGITAADENKRVSSASLVSRTGYASTLYIDDGTGYEERSAGVATETLMDSATGGEQYFSTKRRPIAKAAVSTENTAPYALAGGDALTVKVGGVSFTHNFSADDFISIANATAYEVAASINANSTLDFLARTSDSGTKVVLFSKYDTNEDIEVIAATGADANDALAFPAGRNETIRLYQNDRLLTKDGTYARLSGLPFGQWDTVTGTQTLTASIDGTPAITYSFSDQDFIDAETGFVTVGRNTLAAWVAVINAEIPGITASIADGVIVLTSNLGASARAGVEITGGTLVSARLFSVGSSVGSDRDYTLDRNIGQIRLETALAAGDSLTIGSANTRAFLESDSVATTTLATDAEMWFVVDADAEVVSHGLTSSSSVTFSQFNVETWGHTLKCLAATGTPFENVEVGDYVILWDSILSASLRGARRVIEATDTYFVVERTAADNDAVPVITTLPQLGIAFVRSPGGVIQELEIPAGANYTASSFVTAINDALIGASARVYRTSKIRVSTNTFAETGDIALVTQNTLAAALQLDAGSAIENLSDHVGSVETGNSEIGTPLFQSALIDSTTPGSGDIAEELVVTIPEIDDGYTMVGLRAFDDATRARLGNLQNFHTPIHGSITTLDTRLSGIQPWNVEERFYLAAPFAIGPQDDLDLLVDTDVNKRFGINMFRKLATVGDVYSQTNEYTDDDAGGVTLCDTFGMDFDFNDFAVYMRARAVAFAASSAALLFRYSRHGKDGDGARVRFSNPLTPNTPVQVAVDMETNDTTDIRIHLKGGALRTPTVRSTTQIGTHTASVTNGVATNIYFLNLAIGTAQRTSNVVTITPSVPGTVSDHGLQVGNIVYIQSSSGSFPSGAKTIIARTATTFDYNESGADTAAIAAIGSVSFDSQGESTTTGGGIVIGDFLHLLNPNGTFFGGFDLYTGRVTAVNSTFIQVTSGEATGFSAGTTIDWYPISNAADFQVFANPAETATVITAAVNALAATTNSKVPVDLTVLDSGLGTIDRSTPEFFTNTATWYTLADGVNYVQETIIPVSPVDNYELTFKGAITGSLSTSADWQNEEIYVCPTTAKNVRDWLNAPTVSGLFTACEVERSYAGTKVQIASLTAGANGGVQVQGGLSNAVTAALIGGVRQTAAGSLAISTIRRPDADGLRAGMWCSIENNLSVPRSNIFTSSMTLVSWAADGTVTVGVTPVYTTLLAKTDARLHFERQGKYIAIHDYLGDVTFGAARAGDYIRLQAAIAPGSGLQTTAPNLGIFRIVRTAIGAGATGGVVWIENDLGVEEVSEANVAVYFGESLMPGDAFVVSTPVWGAANQGTWIIESVGLSGGDQFSNTFKFKVSTTTRTPVAQSAIAALDASASLLQAIENLPCRFVMQINGIAPNQDDGSYMDIRWDEPIYSSTMSAAAGSVLTALDKLDYPLELSTGADGYAYNNGLIGEANRVVQGDPTDTSTYPGVAAAGSQINIAGPLVKRISVALSLRTRSGVPNTDISNRVRSAVATVVNQTGIGQPVALSSIVAAAMRVVGVVAVTIVTPSYGVGNDLIVVQPFEKPLVLNLASDIQISFAGE